MELAVTIISSHGGLTLPDASSSYILIMGRCHILISISENNVTQRFRVPPSLRSRQNMALGMLKTFPSRHFTRSYVLLNQRQGLVSWFPRLDSYFSKILQLVLQRAAFGTLPIIPISSLLTNEKN